MNLACHIHYVESLIQRFPLCRSFDGMFSAIRTFLWQDPKVDAPVYTPLGAARTSLDEEEAAIELETLVEGE